jgi:2-dehydropantoate 2-reductase
MKVGVLGAGAVGSMIGGLIKLHEPETDVVLVARGEHELAMRRQGGVYLEGSWGVKLAPVRVAASVADLTASDYMLLTVKSHSTAEALSQAADYIGQALVISIQNGLNQRTLAEFVQAERLIIGVTATSIAVLSPGRVAMQRDDVTVIGPATPAVPLAAVTRAADLLRRARFHAVIDADVVGVQYNKLVFNTLGVAAALSASDFIAEAVLNPVWRNAVAIPLQRESLGVLEQAGIRLRRIPGAADAHRFARLLGLLNLPLLGKLTGAIIRAIFRKKPIRFSLQGDLQAGKKTEVDFINGQIVRLAQEHGIPAPLNRRIVEMVHELEERGGFFTRDDVIGALHIS